MIQRLFLLARFARAPARDSARFCRKKSSLQPERARAKQAKEEVARALARPSCQLRSRKRRRLFARSPAPPARSARAEKKVDEQF
jgi:hypothetical protein